MFRNYGYELQRQLIKFIMMKTISQLKYLHDLKKENFPKMDNQ